MFSKAISSTLLIINAAIIAVNESVKSVIKINKIKIGKNNFFIRESPPKSIVPTFSSGFSAAKINRQNS
jgi:hypothetical protein